MKILELNTEKTWRGGERQTLYNMIGFLEQGHEVEILCRKGFPMEKKSKELNIKVHAVNNGLEAILFLIKNAAKFNILHAQTASGQLYGVISQLVHKVPVVYTRRVDFVPKGFFSKLKYSNTDKLVAITTAIKKILEDFDQTNVALITEIALRKNLNKDRASKLIHFRGWHNKKIIATTAALVQHKDPLTMVRAIHHLSQMRDDFVFLHFGGGVLEQEVEKEIAHLNVARWYHLMGHVDDVEDFFSIFDVFCMSSEEEGLGSSVLDAFMYKVPVVATKAGGMYETVEGNGLLCDIHDPQALALSINELLNDEVLRNAVTQNALEVVERKHSMEAVTSEYISLFKNLTK